MTVRPLRIGVSASFFHADPQRAIFKGKTLLYVEQSLTHWLMSQGALPFLVPPPMPGAPVGLSEIVAALDGVVLQGGADVSPASYGEAPLRPEWAGDPVRDLYEMALLQEAMAQDKPVLGVCRGLQLINTAFGGTLYQDIATQVPGARVHRDWERYDRIGHEILIEPGSPLARLYPGVQEARVNSVHHQAVKGLGKDLQVEARSLEDGLVEAVRLPGPRYVAAVQWHPEFQRPSDSHLLDPAPLLQEFLQETARRKEP